MSDEYRAGECNIGEEEVKYRKRVAGYGSALVAVALYTMLVFFDVPIVMYLLLLVPVFISVHGFNESRHGFCTSYARTGRYNMNNEVGMTLDVISQDKRDKDRKYAKKLIFDSVKLNVLITAVLIGLSRIIN